MILLPSLRPYTQLPVNHATNLLKDHTVLLRAHGELTLEARAGGLDSVLGGCVAAMTRLEFISG